ncbi:MAG: hypothetical protein ACXAAP_12580 [Candidatus Thorarchaeota archaeon]|jgi:hypothetical protein
MSNCKALTASGTPCKHSAREGSDYCGIHEALGSLDVETSPEILPIGTPKVAAVQPNQYKMLVLSIGGQDLPNVGILSASTAEGILQTYYENGYKVHTITKYDRVARLGETPEHFWTLWLLERK